MNALLSVCRKSFLAVPSLVIAGLLGLLALSAPMTARARAEEADEARYVGTLDDGSEIVVEVRFSGPGKYHVVGGSIGSRYLIAGGLFGVTMSGKNFDVLEKESEDGTLPTPGPIGGGDAPSIEDDGATIKGTVEIHGTVHNYSASRN